MSRVSKLLAEWSELGTAIEDLRMEVGLDEMEAERAGLKEAIDKAIVEDGVEYDTDEIKITRVQSHKRVWNVDKLEAILPRPLFRKVIKIAVDPDKLDQLVKAGQVDEKKLDPAFEETPQKAYARWTWKADKSKGSDEAESLAAKLG